MTDMFYFKSGQASIWAQPDGPNTAVHYLGCHEVGDITESEGDFTPLYCPDPAQTDKFVIRDYMRGEPDLPTTEITFPVGKTLDYMEEWDCPGNIIILKQATGRRDLVTNWDRAHVLWHASKTGRTYSAMASRSPDNNEESMVTVPVTFMKQSVLVQLVGRRLTVGEDLDSLAIAFVGDSRCADIDGPRVKRCQYGVVGQAADTGEKASVYHTINSGATWAAAAADPFGNDEDIAAVAYVQVDEDSRRMIVGRSTTDAGNPAEVAYSDDYGATWTAVNVGATNAEFLTGLFALDWAHVWAISNLGRIYVSDDAGASWTVQENAVIHAADYLAIDVMDASYGLAVGESNVVAYTSNGGATWSAITGPSAGDNLTAVAMVTRKRWFVGNDDGELWYTEDGGVSWVQRTFSGSAAGTVQGIRFENEMVGYMIHDTAAPLGRVFRTKDGGYSWELETGLTNVGMTDLAVCGDNHAYVSGLASGSDGFLMEMDSI